MLNTTKCSNEETANTRVSCAIQRAENLAILGSKRVIELCVGPSLRVLEKAYSDVGIEVVGNDIDPRWKNHYPKGNWLIGDAREVSLEGFDTAVFAPPLSKGCSGKRKDALRVSEVRPMYWGFLAREDIPLISVLVLPGRCLTTRRDRRELYDLLLGIPWRFEVDVMHLKDERDRVVKYVDVCLRRRDGP